MAFNATNGETFGNNTLPSECGITMKQNWHNFAKLFRRNFAMLHEFCANFTQNNRVHDFKV